MSYNFKKYVKFRKSYDGISVNSGSVYISHPFMTKLGDFKNVSVGFDTKSKAVLISPTKKTGLGTYQIQKTSPNPFSGSRIGVQLMTEGMPEGRYLYHDDTKDGLVCVYTQLK